MTTEWQFPAFIYNDCTHVGYATGFTSQTPAAVIRVRKLPVGFLPYPNTSHPLPAFQGLDQFLSWLVCDALNTPESAAVPIRAVMM
ncbi:hypothetical protein P7K49_028527, partial [Saguinus oedipus]